MIRARLLSLIGIALLAFSALALSNDHAAGAADAAALLSLDRPISQQHNDCAIVATLATARLSRAGVWNRMLRVVYRDRVDGKIYGHMLAVWQPHRGGHVFIYDDYFIKATHTLETDARNSRTIATEFAQAYGIALLAAKFDE